VGALGFLKGVVTLGHAGIMHSSNVPETQTLFVDLLDHKHVQNDASDVQGQLADRRT